MEFIKFLVYYLHSSLYVLHLTNQTFKRIFLF